MLACKSATPSCPPQTQITNTPPPPPHTHVAQAFLICGLNVAGTTRANWFLVLNTGTKARGSARGSVIRVAVHLTGHMRASPHQIPSWWRPREAVPGRKGGVPVPVWSHCPVIKRRALPGVVGWGLGFASARHQKNTAPSPLGTNTFGQTFGCTPSASCTRCADCS